MTEKRLSREKIKKRKDKNVKESARPAHLSRSCAVQGKENQSREKRKTAISDKKKFRRRQRNLRAALLVLSAALILLIVGILFLRFVRGREEKRRQQMISGAEAEQNYGPEQWQQEGAPYIDVELLTPNEYSRPQITLSEVNYIAIHYTANPGATAMNNRDYFNNLAVTHEAKVSSHFVVGIEGEVVQCIPTSEISYATNERNVDTISIECCHPDETGEFTDATYDAAVQLTAWLCTRYSLTEEQVIRHYDVTGKECPKYYVEHPDAWEQMKADIAARIQEDYVLQENLK